MIHQLRAPTVSGHRNSAANNFSKSCKVPLDAKKFLRGAVAQAESGDNFIDDQQRTVSMRDFS